METESNDDLLQFDEKCENTWMQYLGQFEREVWPMFEKRGFTRGEAMVLWEMNRMYNVLFDIKTNTD